MRTMLSSLALVLVAACGRNNAPATTPTPQGAAAAEPIADACASPEHRQLDFWVGDWNLVVRSRAAPGSEEWAESVGTQHITSILAGCAIEENFVATGPGGFRGRSFSSYDPITSHWRQTWVDDSGSYLAFQGGPEGDTFVLYGEPRSKDGKDFQMRMVYSQITHDHLRWEWQRSEDGWAHDVVMIGIDYTRR